MNGRAIIRSLVLMSVPILLCWYAYLPGQGRGFAFGEPWLYINLDQSQNPIYVSGVPEGGNSR